MHRSIWDMHKYCMFHKERTVYITKEKRGEKRGGFFFSLMQK